MKLIETLESLITNEKYVELNKIIQTKFPEYYSTQLMEELFNWIEKSGVKSIKFDTIRAGGMAHYNHLIINKYIINSGFCFFLYVLLHETSHYYQFKKHGMDLELLIFKNNDTKEILKNILNVELIADRLAIMKFNSLSKKYKFNCNTPVSEYSKVKENTQQYNALLHYVGEIKKEVIKKNITSHTEIADIIYNYIKI